jgi:hypothetical protein
MNTIATPEELLANSKRRLQVADHFLTQTYKFVQDPKLLLNVLDGLLRALEELVDALLLHEREAGRIPAYHEDSFAAKLSLLKGDAGKRYNITQIDVHMITEMQELMHEHKTSALEFQRKGAVIMATEHYRLSTVNIDRLKTYLTRAKTLHSRINDTIIAERR